MNNYPIPLPLSKAVSSTHINDFTRKLITANILHKERKQEVEPFGLSVSIVFSNFTFVLSSLPKFGQLVTADMTC